MKFKILSDSTCDLPKQYLEQYDITLTPLTVVKGGEDFKDGVTINPGDIFAHVDAGGDLCSTSAVSVGEYVEYFTKYSKEYDGVLQINIGSGYSASCQNACVAAENFDNVRCIDSLSLSVGQGLITLKAAQLAGECSSLDELYDAVMAYLPKVEGSFVLDQLRYMAKGGRCTSATALGANLLKLKPCIELFENKLEVVKKYRGNYVKCLTTYIHDRLSGRTDIDDSVVFVVHSVDLGEAELNPVWEEVRACGFGDSAVEAFAGCTISCHCGPGTLGVMYLKK